MEQKIGYINNYAGVVVSLNQKKSTYIGVGEIKSEPGKMKVWLSPHKWCTKLPEGLNDEDARQIQMLIKDGILVEGKHYLPPAKKDPKVLKDYLELARTTRYLNDQAKEPFRELFKKKQDGYYSAFEIFNECLKQETNTQNRSEWIAFLSDAIKSFDGPKFLVEDYENDPEVYTITIDQHTGSVTSDSRDTKGKSKKSKAAPEAQVEEPEVSPEQKEALLKKYLGDSI